MKLIASDMDGTIFFKNEDGTSYIKIKDLQAINQWQNAGNLFGVCTGRPPLATYMDTDNIIDCDFYIANTGAIILNKDKEVIYEKTIDANLAKEIADLYKDQYVVFIQANHIINVYGKELWHMPIISSFDDLKGAPIHGVSIVTVTEQQSADIVAYLDENYPTIKGFQNKASVDIVDVECSKGKALQRVKTLFNANQTLAIGDSYNDLSMIVDADIGLTFKDAAQDIQAQADDIVSSMQEAIQKYI